MRFSRRAPWDLCGALDFKVHKVYRSNGCSKTSLCFIFCYICCRKKTYIMRFDRTVHPFCDILVYFSFDSWISWTILCFWLTSGSRVLLWRPEPHSVPAFVVPACATDESPSWSSDAFCHRCHPQPALPGAEWIPASGGELWLVAPLHLDSLIVLFVSLKMIRARTMIAPNACQVESE